MLNYHQLKRPLIATVFLLLGYSAKSQQITLKNDLIQRTFSYQGKVWRTIKFSNGDGSRVLNVTSEEFNILPLDGNKTLSVADFTSLGKPRFYKHGDTTFLEIKYKPLSAARANSACPELLVVNHFVAKGDRVIRKKIRMLFSEQATVDRLEVERFVAKGDQQGGGRGEPVFVDHSWFFGLEYPGGYSRCRNGNFPASFSRYYDKVGNYSFIDLEGRDIEPDSLNGLIRLMHFPGYALPHQQQFELNSKVSVVGVSSPQQDVRQAFMQYLSTIWKAPRSFLNYNNWFDQKAKNLKGDNFVEVYKQYKNILDPYGIKIDAMVPDDGWQDRKGIWNPSPAFFPQGDTDLELLSQKLKKEGTGFGLWLSLNSYNNNIDWGLKNGYREAGRNAYFKQYGRYYSLSATKYRDEILKRIPELAKKANLVYFKHDFNELCDLSEGNNHPATDRHGHEANLDVALQVLVATKKVKPEIFQNLTNWIWFSPWWLQYADYLWMLAGDDGINGNTPEISTKAMFSTDRDTYIWRLYGNPADQPLVPISRLMTHGILQTSPADKEIPLQDWMDYVLMHYGRGTLLKEWYISLDAMTTEQWKTLSSVHSWAKQHEAALNNVRFVGGRPDEGNAYGYIGWEKNKGVFVARNTGPAAQKLVIPFNEAMGFYGAKGTYKANVVYPYQDLYPATFKSGENIEIEIPGYSTMAFEFEQGTSSADKTPERNIDFSTTKVSAQTLKTVLTIPANVKRRCDLLLIGYPQIPDISINGKTLPFSRQTKALLNNFASYAISGMPSTKAADWKMAAIDLSAYAGQTVEIVYSQKGKFESHLLYEKNVEQKSSWLLKTELLPLTNDTRRGVIQLY
ncbi:Melibiase [Pedobacter steynii]|uniref:Melibiase n=1 Tax=Pedobacter steynii TaxID=430522 RepID=A0A1G9P0L8_9SPHI|nr:alpha-galactosidase [Pedobacter steynii]NQX39126.1 alpha-galactosidase [Pedobacter steynii]SDL92396.1 Melibiase [Pedobacter steynii]